MRLTGFSAPRRMPRKSALAAALASLLLFATPATGSADQGSGAPGPVDAPPAATASDGATAAAIAALDEVTETLTQEPAEPGVLSSSAAPPADLSSQLAELSHVYDDLPDAEQRIADRILARPTNGTDPLNLVSYGNRNVKSSCDSRICVHWVTTGPHSATDQWARTVRDQVSHAWQVEVGQMGYPAPVSDGKAGNPSGVSGYRLDVYLGSTLSAGVYGYAATEQPATTAAYLVLDRNFEGLPISPLNALRVTAAHEFFHAIQFGYGVDPGMWFMESTATWVEERVHDPINDNRQYLRGKSPLTNPGRSLDDERANPYGSWIFFEHLSQTHGPTVVRDVWTMIGTGMATPRAINKALRVRGTNLRTEFARFAGSNTIPAKTYAEGRFYPKAKPTAKPKLGKKRRASSWEARKVDHLAATTVRFRPAGKLGKKWRLRATVKGPGRLQVELIALRTDGTLARKQIKVTGGKKSIGSTFSTRKVKWVAVTVANTSTKAKHNNTRVKVKGTIKKK